MERSSLIWFRRRIYSWFLQHGRSFPWRKESASCYQQVIAEALLQRTRAEMVARVFVAFVRRFPSWRTLAAARRTDLTIFLKPLGLWKRRAASIQKLSKEMARRHGRFPRTRDEIEKLPGVGQYIANAVLLFCYDQPEPLVDVNMARVLERFFGPRKLADIRYDPYLQELAHGVIPQRRAKEFNWAVLDLAALVCRTRQPLCTTCILRMRCLFFREGLCTQNRQRG
jgi:A/G-specific adenine glycosylase